MSYLSKLNDKGQTAWERLLAWGILIAFLTVWACVGHVLAWPPSPTWGVENASHVPKWVLFLGWYAAAQRRSAPAGLLWLLMALVGCLALGALALIWDLRPLGLFQLLGAVAVAVWSYLTSPYRVRACPHCTKKMPIEATTCTRCHERSSKPDED
jgi:hypothetical protein